jgi:hypothetical protein
VQGWLSNSSHARDHDFGVLCRVHNLFAFRLGPYGYKLAWYLGLIMMLLKGSRVTRVTISKSISVSVSRQTAVLLLVEPHQRGYAYLESHRLFIRNARLGKYFAMEMAAQMR